MAARTRGRRKRPATAAGTGRDARRVDYRALRNPFPRMKVFPDDRIAAIHQASLKVLSDLGIRVLLPEAREIFARAGARVAGEMVFIGPEIVVDTLATAPRRIVARAGARARDVVLEPGSLIFQPGAGAPHASDALRGRRPGSARDFAELVRLTQHFDVLHMVPPVVEPQDVPVNLRHLEMTETQLALSDKLPFVYARGTGQAEDAFEMIRLARGLSEEAFAAEPHTYTIVNTNSPRTLDRPMARGLIDFARAGQLVIVTPFTLMGAMAPITVAGALTLSHAEALAAIALTQLARPGAPVAYGTFTSNVDMRSGAPAFGTPAHFQASLAAGQLADLIGLPWRSAAGSAAAVNDVQAANENQFGLWGCLLAGATVVIHAAGWLEGGLTVSYEKLICDVEVLNMIAELCAGAAAGDDAIGFDAIAEVPPSGHFFAAGQTMERYRTEFYEPIVHDYANFGTWSEAGARDAHARATELWQAILADPPPPVADPEALGRAREFARRRAAAGGANPES